MPRGGALPALLLMFLTLALPALPGLAHGADYVEDSAITSRLETGFRFDPAVPFDSVAVSTERGIVTLTGRVDSLDEASAARENACEGGAVPIIKDLELKD